MGDENDDGGPAPALRVAGVAAVLAILSTLLAAPGVYWLLHHEPHDDVAQILLLVFIVPATLIVTARTLWWALRNSRRRSALRCVAMPLLAGAIGIGGLLGAEPLHWRASKNDFDAVADGAPFPCDPKQRCRIGWWTITDNARDETVTVVWFPTEHHSCYGGRGLAHPNDQTIDEQGLRAAITKLTRRSELFVTPARDGWYHVCATS